MKNYKRININNIKLWDDNPRGVDIHSDSLSQREIIDSFFSSNKKIKEMKNLAEDIAIKKLSPTDFICIWHDIKNDKFISMDGNRRVLSLKILFNPSIIEHNKDLHDFYSKIDTVNLEQEIFAYVTEDYDEALEIVEKRHLGEDEGRGLKTWESKEKDFFKSNIKPQTTKQISNSYLLRTKFKDKFEDIVERLSSTSVDRIIGYQKVREHFGVSDYSFINDQQADNLLKYLEAAEKYQEEKDIRLSRFKVSDALKVIESMGSKKVPLTLNESKTLPTIKLKSNPVELFKDHTLQLDSLILNKNEFTTLNINPLSDKTHYNNSLNIFESTNQPGEYQFKFSGFRGTDEIASTIVRVIVKKPHSLPLSSNSLREEKTLISKSGYPINISSDINKIIDEINSVAFHDLSYIITISLRFVLHESIKVLFNNKNWDTNFNNLKDAIQKLKDKLLEQNNQNIIQTKTKSESNSVKNMAEILNVEETASLLNHLTHTSRTQISMTRILDLAQNEISTLLVYISALLN